MGYYETLGINKNASPDEIKKAYRKLSLRYHPDKPTGDESKFKEINEAYSTLGDVEKKRIYDSGGNNLHRTFSSPNGGFDDLFNMFFDVNEQARGANMSGMPFGIPPQFFNSNMKIFHNGKPVNMNNFNKPVPLCKTITISFKDSFNGISYPIEFERWISIGGIKKTEKEKIYIPIPPGIDDGEIIVVKKKGNIIDNTNMGDLKIFIKITNDTIFKRNGLDLICEKIISLKEALTGFNLEMEYLNGKILSMNNDGNTIITPNYLKVIEKFGFTRNNDVGNLIIKFNVEFPNELSKEQKNKLKDIL
uniref:J domain-containing protein n=1 Tax=viral metagenome TaxID=1070528 RepID=A0A6C0C222_9ZZZZ